MTSMTMAKLNRGNKLKGAISRAKVSKGRSSSLLATDFHLDRLKQGGVAEAWEIPRVNFTISTTISSQAWTATSTSDWGAPFPIFKSELRSFFPASSCPSAVQAAEQESLVKARCSPMEDPRLVCSRAITDLRIVTTLRRGTHRLA